MKKQYELIDAYGDHTRYLERIVFPKRKVKNIPKALYVSLFLLPVIIFFLSISENSAELINQRIKVFLIIFFAFDLLYLIINSIKIYLRRSDYDYSISKLSRSLAVTIALFTLTMGVSYTMYGDDVFKEWLVSKAMSTTDHQYLATWFYDRGSISNIIKDMGQSSKAEKDLMSIEGINYEPKKYANKYEEDLFAKENEDDIYKIIPISGTVNGSSRSYSGYMTIVYDPADVTLAISAGASTEPGNYGQVLSVLHQNSGALVSMNAGGFYDPYWRSNGGIPHGDIIKDGKLLTSFPRGIETGGMVGFNNENKLVLKRMGAEQALAEGIRDAVDWGPYLVVNGRDLFPNKSHYTWAVGRTAIGQRPDGIVLLVVIDGMQAHSHGASYSDLSSLFLKYGATNASSMDGGTSTSMYADDKYLNNPFNGHVRTIRQLPNAWIVKKAER